MPKSLRRHFVALLAPFTLAVTVLAQDPAPSPVPITPPAAEPEASATSASSAAPSASPAASPKYPAARLGNELALYTPSESPWAEVKGNHALELHLFGLMRAEVRMWGLQELLATGDAAARENATEVSRILHEQIIADATETLPLLKKTPNKPFALLLVHQLEAYPFDWAEEGSEQLLPSLHKFVDPPPAKPAKEENSGGRRHRRANSAQ